MNKSEHNPNDMVSRTEYSLLSKAHENTNSLKCTVPAFIVKLLDLKHGERLAWHTEGSANGIIITVTKEERKEP